jgi:release factor glutamine methyltransferase
VSERVAPGASIAAALDQASERLARAALANPRREATALWAGVAGAGTKPGDVWLRREATPPLELVERFGEAVRRRARGVPFAYAVGRVGFRTLDLTLDQRALIPRPETEGLVDLVLREAGRREAGGGTRGILADIGTGCGCLALSLAVEGDFERVIAVERSPAAAALARENVELVRPPVPVEVRERNLLAPLAGVRCRAIVANPPYLTEAEYATLDAAVRDFEPREALVSGVDGLDATRALLAGAAACLAPQGLVAIEIDERRAEQVRDLARGYGWDRVAIHEDLFGRPRFLLAFAKEEA